MAGYLNVLGLILDFAGIIVLLIYSEKIVGATTPADQDFLASRWWLRTGYILLAIGFLIQIISNIL
jgi:hypothetical protein